MKLTTQSPCDDADETVAWEGRVAWFKLTIQSPGRATIKLKIQSPGDTVGGRRVWWDEHDHNHCLIFRVVGCRIVGIGSQVSGFGFRILGVRCPVSGFGFWIQSLGHLVWDSNVLVLDLKVVVSQSLCPAKV